MGEVSEMMQDGLLCEVCGVYMGDENLKKYGKEEPGFPVQCKECKDGLYLFGIGKDGLGNTGIELMVFFDFKKKILYPIFCREVKIKK